MPSPTPMKRSGFGHWREIAATTPPLAVPSSLVTHQAGDADGLVEGFHLHQGVLADVRIEHQQHLVRGGGGRPC